MHPSTNRLVTVLASVAMIGFGFAPMSHAGVVSSADALDREMRQVQIAGIADFLERDAVAELFIERGVAPEGVAERLAHLTDEELAMLQTAVDGQIAGGDALGVIGAVFLVLLILELVGVTDIFKSI